jgi:exodeoxyribonuclease V alpha subunit
MATMRMLVPTGAAREALGARRDLPRPRDEVAFPRDLLLGAGDWEDGPELLHLSWELARCAEGATAAEQRGLCLLAFSTLVAARAGSTRVPVGGALAGPAREELLGRLQVSSADAAALQRVLDAPSDGARAVLGQLGERKPLLRDGDWLYAERMRQVEDRLVEQLQARLRHPPLCTAARARKAAAQVFNRPPMVSGHALAPSPEQEDAVRTALQQALTVITGGPGTGKTSIVVSVVRALAQLGLAPEAIALAAPTGKAAHRMDASLRGQLRGVLEQDALDAELLGRLAPARTLHRLLGYSPTQDRYLHHAQNLLPCGAVLIDEASMVDLFLMERLLRALPVEARLVLLGDAEQLPSVDAGAVFRDLVAPADAAAGDLRVGAGVRLTQSYRMNPADPDGRNILAVAQAINHGVVPAQSESGDGALRLRETVGSLQRRGVELLPCVAGDALHQALLQRHLELLRPERLEPGVRRAYRFPEGRALPEDQGPLEALFAQAESMRLLCLTRGERDPAGTGAINGHLHALALQRLRAEDPGLRGEPALVPGEPVVVERNDPARELFNGDGGLVLRGVGRGEQRQRFLAVFRDGEGFRAFDLDGLRSHLALAYALTIHKAQGSEVNAVTLVLPSRDVPLLSRELLYTAVTRARRSVILAGDAQLLAAGIRRKLQRHSGVGERLGEAGPTRRRRATR